MKFNLKLTPIILALLLPGCANLDTPNFHSSAIYTGSPSGLVTESSKKNDSEFELHWPVGKVKITQGFKTGPFKTHDGVDLVQFLGAPIFAAHDGIIIYTGAKYRGYGKMIMIEYNNTWASVYAHLKTIQVKEGQVVKAGDQIGLMGRSGRVTGTHLHFELLQNKIPVDPLLYLKGDQRFVRN